MDIYCRFKWRYIIDMIKFRIYNIQTSHLHLYTKIKANILAIEAAFAEGKDNIMKSWKKYSKGKFVHHKLPTDHHGILDETHLPKIVKWVLEHTR